MGREVRRERDARLLRGKAREHGLDLGDVAMPGGRVGLHAALHLAQVRPLGRRAAGTRDARLAIHCDRPVGQPGLGQRREGEQRRGRVAAGARDPARARDPGTIQLGQRVHPGGVETLVGAEIDDRAARFAERLGQRVALAVREREEGDVAVGERGDVQAARSRRSGPGRCRSAAPDAPRSAAPARVRRSPTRRRLPQSTWQRRPSA